MNREENSTTTSLISLRWSAGIEYMWSRQVKKETKKEM